MNQPEKILIIRFSSLGDIAQALPCANWLAPAEVHWLTRHDFAAFVQLSPAVHKVWAFERSQGLAGLIHLALQLRQEHFTHIYDAHSNMRSRLVCFILKCGRFHTTTFARRSKDRLKRVLLFWFRLNLFPKPFRGALSYLRPIQKWQTTSVSPTQRSRAIAGATEANITVPLVKLNFPPQPQLSDKLQKRLTSGVSLESCLLFAPSATWELKRWPTAYWTQLASQLTGKTILILGGPEDTFCQAIAAVAPERIHNLAGQLSWVESAYLVSQAGGLVAGDTGLLHVADILGRPNIALIGPTASGFPSRESSHVADVELYCRPCTKDGRGRCRNKTYQKCLRDITPQMISQKLASL